MSIAIFNQESDVVDDFEGIDEFVCLASGDIYIDDEPFGTYRAMWIAEGNGPINILVTSFRKVPGNNYLGPALTIGLQYFGVKGLVAVDPYSLPWGDAEDGICLGQFVKPENYEDYSLASRSFEIAQEVVKLDGSIRARFSL